MTAQQWVSLMCSEAAQQGDKAAAKARAMHAACPRIVPIRRLQMQCACPCHITPNPVILKGTP